MSTALRGAFVTGGGEGTGVAGHAPTPTLPINSGNLVVPVSGQDVQDYIDKASTPLQILQATASIFFNAGLERIRKGEDVSNGVAVLLRQGANVAASAARYMHSPQPVAIINLTPDRSDSYEDFLNTISNEPIEDAEIIQEQLPPPP